MATTLSDYQDKYKTIRLTREDGVLTVQMHTDGVELKWGAVPHDELGWCFADIAGDADNEIVIITGTADTFIAHFNTGEVDNRPPHLWDRVYAEGKRLLTNLLEVPVPMIAAINGPATVHAEIGLLCDIVLASDTAVFSDITHFPSGLVPGDGVHVVWPMLLGQNRGRYFLLTGEELSAQQALDLDIVAEVLAAEDLMPRAVELAAKLKEQPVLARRYARQTLTMQLKRTMQQDLGHGLVLEGMSAAEYWPRGRDIRP